MAENVTSPENLNSYSFAGSSFPDGSTSGISVRSPQAAKKNIRKSKFLIVFILRIHFYLLKDLLYKKSQLLSPKLPLVAVPGTVKSVTDATPG